MKGMCARGRQSFHAPVCTALLCVCLCVCADLHAQRLCQSGRTPVTRNGRCVACALRASSGCCAFTVRADAVAADVLAHGIPHLLHQLGALDQEAAAEWLSRPEFSGAGGSYAAGSSSRGSGAGAGARRVDPYAASAPARPGAAAPPPPPAATTGNPFGGGRPAEPAAPTAQEVRSFLVSSFSCCRCVPHTERPLLRWCCCVSCGKTKWTCKKAASSFPL